ncbi:MAG: glycosyltransferase family 4 protein, partial [Actinobacteria bacterium]|nr:glycosyltransferase family 4 protein [Actinomycetota bacterium]
MRVAVEDVPGPDEVVHRALYSRCGMRVLLADPPAYTPQYDHALARALARAGATVDLVTSPFRFGPTPTPVGYRVHELFYPASSRIGGRARLALKAIEHPLGMAGLAARGLLHTDVLHVQWLAAPELDGALLRSRVPRVFTAHDLLPRRTAHRAALWLRLLSRFDRIVVHSRRGRDELVALGVPADRLFVIPHPVFPSDVRREDDGRTVLHLGVIRPYKGLPDAVEAILGVRDARLLVAGDPRIPIDAHRVRAGDRAEWWLGYLRPEEIRRALTRATIGLFPYRPELDQSGALLEVLGAGIPAVVYDVGGLGEVVRRFEAGRVVAPGDVEALRAAIDELLHDSAALAAARAG